MEVELREGTSIREVIKTLEELGFSYEFENGNEMVNTTHLQMLQTIYDKFLLITQEHNELIRMNNDFYQNWLSFGYDLVDAVHNNKSRTVKEVSQLTQKVTSDSVNQISDQIDNKPDVKLKVHIDEEETLPLMENNKNSCKFCMVFRDLGTMVCPQCGSPLNTKSAHV
jgi:hypothetical protein